MSAEPISYEPSLKNALKLCRDELFLARCRASADGHKYFAYCYQNAIDKADSELIRPSTPKDKE